MPLNTFSRQVHAADETDSSSTTTGGLICSGGAGIAKNLHVGNSIFGTFSGALINISVSRFDPPLATIAAATRIILDYTKTFFSIQGTTTIETLTHTDYLVGTVLMLHFNDAVTIKHQTYSTGFISESIILNGSADLSMTSGGILMLMHFASRWREISRMVP